MEQTNFRGSDLKIREERENLFRVELDGRVLRLECRDDNEGATHWLDLDQDRETPEAREIGAWIEQQRSRT